MWDQGGQGTQSQGKLFVMVLCMGNQTELHLWPPFPDRYFLEQAIFQFPLHRIAHQKGQPQIPGYQLLDDTAADTGHGNLRSYLMLLQKALNTVQNAGTLLRQQ